MLKCFLKTVRDITEPTHRCLNEGFCSSQWYTFMSLLGYTKSGSIVINVSKVYISSVSIKQLISHFVFRTLDGKLRSYCYVWILLRKISSCILVYISQPNTIDLWSKVSLSIFFSFCTNGETGTCTFNSLSWSSWGPRNTWLFILQNTLNSVPFSQN